MATCYVRRQVRTLYRSRQVQSHSVRVRSHPRLGPLSIQRIFHKKRYINAHVDHFADLKGRDSKEELLVVEIELNRLGTLVESANFELPANVDPLHYTSSIELSRTRGELRAAIRLRSRPRKASVEEQTRASTFNQKSEKSSCGVQNRRKASPHQPGIAASASIWSELTSRPGRNSRR